MPARLTTEDFVKKATAKHGGKYLYDETVYTDCHTKVKIGCPIHGFFLQLPSAHLYGQGCPKCKAEKTKQLFSKPFAVFLEQMKNLYKDMYDFSNSVYKSTHEKMEVRCKKHGIFSKSPHDLLIGRGCPVCCHGQRLDTRSFVQKSKERHGDFYGYDKVVYVNNTTHVIVTCPIHGDFSVLPSVHLAGHSCPKCGRERIRKALSENKKFTQEQFLAKCVMTHGDKYDYSQSVYTGSSNKVCIICPQHGAFWQMAQEHMSGKGCPRCSGFGKTTDDFIREAKAEHGEYYSYEKTQYVDSQTKVCITCPAHGDFYILPHNHTKGSGCPKCNRKKGENKIAAWLDRNNVNYIWQYEVPNEYLFSSHKIMRIDFFLPNHNLCIEYNGGQHYMPVRLFGGEDAFEKQKERDYAVEQYCKRHNLKLLVIPYTKYKAINKILEETLL